MQIIRKLFLLLFVSLMSSIYVKGQVKSFTIKMAGFKIGTMSASHTKADNMDYYKMISDVDISFVIKVKVHFETIATYKDNIMIESTVNSLVNGKHYLSHTIWNGHKYIINCVSHKYEYSDSSRYLPIVCSVSKLYFEKPRPYTEVFAETYGKINKVEYSGQNEVKFEITNSKQIYSYDNLAQLNNVEVVNTIKNFEIVRN